MSRKRAPLWLKVAAIFVVAVHYLLIASALISPNNTIPALDEWFDRMNASVAVKTARGQLSLGDIFSVYNSHRLPFTLGLTALNTAIFGYDARYEIIVTIILMTLNFGLLTILLSWQLGHAPRLFWLGLIMLAFVVFTGRWLRGWTWGFMNLWQFGILFTLLGIIAVTRMKLTWRLAMLLAILCSLAAFSNGAGVLTFGAVGLVWWLRGERNWKRWALFSAVAALCFTSVFLVERFGYSEVTLSPLENLYFVALHLGSVQMTPPAMRYFLPESTRDFALPVFGAGCIFIAVNAHFLIQRRKLIELMPSLALILWSISFALATSIGRFEEYIGAITHIDYHTPMTMLFWIGASMLSLKVIKETKNGLSKANLLFVVSISCAQAILTFIAALYIYSPVLRLDEQLTQMRECLFTALIGNRNCSVFEVVPLEMTQRNALGLAQLKIGPFREIEQTPVPFPTLLLPILYSVSDFPSREEVKVAVLENEAQYVLFQRTARLLQSLSLPDLPDYRFTLRGALTADAACADQGIRARLIADDGQTQRIAIERVVTTELTPFALDLTEWRGRDFSLLYELDIPEPLTCGHVLWANPRVEFSLRDVAKVEGQ